MPKRTCTAAASLILFTAALMMTTLSGKAATPAQTRAIAKEAYIYGYPMVQTYLTMCAFSIDKK